MLTLESAVFLLSSIISIGVIYFNLPKNMLFILLSIILASLLVFYNKYPLSYLQQKEHKLPLLFALFLSGLFIQALLIATGGFFSAFIIILHLYTLGMSFLFNVRSAMVFLLLSLGVLISTVVFDTQMQGLFKSDPWSFILHGISFMIIIPLAHLVVSTYQMKDALSKMLTEHLATKEMQDESIFRGIGEFVFIIDKQLKVIFANEAVKKTLELEASEVIGEDIFSVLPLESQTGIPADIKTLSINQAIADKSVHKVKGFSIVPKKNGAKRLPVLIQIRPIFESNDKLKQIVMVLTPDFDVTSNDSVDAKMLITRRTLLKAELERELVNNNDIKSMQHFMLLMAQIEDLLLYQDLEIHGNNITEHKALLSGVDLLKSTTNNLSKLLSSFDLRVDIEETQEELVKFATVTGLTGFSLYSYRKQNFLISIEQYYAGLMFERIIRLFSMLNLPTEEKKIIIRAGYNDSDLPTILIAAKILPNISVSTDQLLLQNYGSLNKDPNLSVGSGLEGLLSKKIAELLNVKFTLQYSQKSGYLQAIINLPKDENVS